MAAFKRGSRGCLEHKKEDIQAMSKVCGSAPICHFAPEQTTAGCPCAELCPGYCIPTHTITTTKTIIQENLENPLTGFAPMHQLRVYGVGKTNYDKLRAKSIEEMAEWIGESIDCEVCKTMHHTENDECPSNPHQACVNFWLDWLRQEATP